MTGQGEIGAIRVNLSLDSIDFSRGVQDVNRRINALNSEFRAISQGSARFDNSLDTLRQRADVLSRTMDTHRAKVEELKRQYEESARASGEGSAETLRLARSYNQAIAAMNRTEQQLNSVNSQIEDQTDKWKVLERQIEQTGESMTNAGEKMQGVGQTLTASVTAPIAGLALMAGKAALDFDQAAGVIQAEIGNTGISAEKLQRTAEELWENGFGDSMESVAVKVAGVGKALGDLSEVDLSNVTKGLDLFEKRGWADQQEALRAVKVLMEQFGMSASQAMDYLTKGFQENLNYSGEFLDSVSEYSNYFAEFGLSADDMFAKFKSSAESGNFALDKIGDSMKEFSLRAKDGSKTSAEAFQALGLNAAEMTKQFNTGGETAKKAFEIVVKALQNTNNETVRNSASVGLFGTQYEDLGEKAFDAMLQASQGLEGVEGATKKASDALNDNFGARAQKVWREFQADLKPVGEDLLEIAEDVLPKVADTVEKVTDAFADMSPEGQKTVLAIAGIAAAAGPASIAIGTLSTGIGTALKVVAPLIPALGAGGGLAAAFTALTGPVGLTVAGIGLATAGFFAYKDSVEKSKTVNLEHAESLIKQQGELSNLTTRYNELADKNRLTTDEMLKYLDVQTRLQTETDPSKIENLTAVMKLLQERSGLTNEEITEMLGLNDQIIKTAPEVDKAYSERGNAIIKNKDALDEVNNKLRENIQLELENQQIKNDANLNQNIQDYITALGELSAAEEKRNAVKAERDAKEQEVLDLRLEKERAIREGNEAAITIAENELMLQEGNLNGLNQELSKRADIVTEKQNGLNKSQEEIEKTQAIYNKMINLQLAQAGINAEGAEGVAQLDDAIAKTQGRIQTLMLLSKNQGGLNEQQQEELDLLEQQHGNLVQARDEIKGIQSEQASVNQKIAEGTGKAKELTDELDKDVTKNVTVDDQGKAKQISDEASRPVTKNVSVVMVKGNTLEDLMPKTWSLTVKPKMDSNIQIPGFYAPGNNAKGTKNWRGGLTWVGEEGPELVNLPKGAKVIPNGDSEAILRKWNIPMLATGGVTLTEGMAYVGERGRELVDLRGAVTNPYMSQSNNEINRDLIIEVPVILEGREVARGTYRYISELTESATRNKLRARGK